MYIYIICPVRAQTGAQGIDIERYVEDREQSGDTVFYPKRNAPQNDPTGYNIVTAELEAIKKADEVHVFWDVTSRGSHFDLGMAYALGKTIIWVDEFQEDAEGKSYVKAMAEYNKQKTR